jgi:hypothetical protein
MPRTMIWKVTVWLEDLWIRDLEVGGRSFAKSLWGREKRLILAHDTLLLTFRGVFKQSSHKKNFSEKSVEIYTD